MRTPDDFPKLAPPPHPDGFMSYPTVDPVKACALGNAVDHHRRRIGDPPDVHDVLATADAFVSWLRGGEAP